VLFFFFNVNFFFSYCFHFFLPLTPFGTRGVSVISPFGPLDCLSLSLDSNL
jgi:hypothetical protein